MANACFATASTTWGMPLRHFGSPPCCVVGNSSWSTDDLASLLSLDRQEEFFQEEREEPELLAVVTPNSSDANVAVDFFAPSEETIDEIRLAQWYGRANQLSHEHVVWPVIDEVTATTRMPQDATLATAPCELVSHWQPSGPALNVDAQQIIHQRRSCLALDGKSRLSRDVCLRMVARTLPGPHTPCDALYWATTIHLALFVHRVDGITPGLYPLVRDPAKK